MRKYIWLNLGKTKKRFFIIVENKFNMDIDTDIYKLWKNIRNFLENNIEKWLEDYFNIDIEKKSRYTYCESDEELALYE